MGYLILFGWLMILPFCTGAGFCSLGKTKKEYSLTARWLWGQVLLWALFQIIAVHFVLQGGTLTDVVYVYTIAAAVVGIGGVLLSIRTWKDVDKHTLFKCPMCIKEQKWLCGLFTLLWLVQMGMLLFAAVNDGDDAFYMAVAKKAEEAGSLYTANVYSFGNTELNYRYALAPFPIWIAYLSKISGVHTLVIGHVILGIVLVTMSYVVYAQIGRVLFGEDYKKRMLFLIFVAILYIFGNTSSHTAESFLLLRTRQGKALVAGLVFPILICLLLQIGKRLEQKKQVMAEHYILAAAVILSGCLGSTLGGALVILLWASAMFLLAVGYRTWKLLLFGALSALPGFVYALLYLMN